ncbi:MAG: EAL domain-containing protein [Rhodoferax sp.]
MNHRVPPPEPRLSYPSVVAMAVFLVAALVSGLLIWKQEQRSESEKRLRIAALANDHANAIQTAMDRALSVTYALSALVRQGKGQVPDFESLASEMLRLYPGVSVLGLAPGGVIQRVVPLAGNEKTIGFDTLQDPIQGAETRRAIETGQLTLAGPHNLVQGGRGVIGRLPIFLDNAEGKPVFWGLAYAVIRFPQALSVVRINQLQEHGLNYTLWRTAPDTGARQVILASTTADLVAPVEQSLSLPNGQWTLSVAPIGGWRDTATLLLQMALGLVFSLTVAYTAKLMLDLKAHEKGQEALIAERTRAIAASQNKLQATLDALPDLMVELGLDGTCHDFHAPRMEENVPRAHFLVGKKVSDALPPDATHAVMAALHEAAQNGYVDQREFFLQLPQGTYWFEISVARKASEPGGEPRFILLSRNITERKQTESELRVAATAFNSQEGMAITGTNKIILRVNPAFTAITGYGPDETSGKSLNFLNSGRHDAAFYADMWASVHATGVWHGEVWNRRKNGEIYPDWRTITAVKDEQGTITHYVNSFTDITQRKATEEEINKLAFYDPLTGLPNRRLLLDRLRQALAVSSRSGRLGALQFIDLDNFKTLNDTLGHDMGDRLLLQVAERLTGCMRQGDTVARLGGDEFVVMLEELSVHREEAAAHAEVVGEKILATINLPYRLAGLEYHITPSIGITLYSGNRESTDELLKQADLAMYQAKSAGRNTLRFFDPAMQAVVTARAALESDIRQGILKAQFQLYYQPQINRSGKAVGAEALLRWPHPTRGMVSPMEFIGLAEDTGLILPLGNWVMETACSQLAAWARQERMQHLTLAVNVSARQFRQQDFVPYVLDLLSYTGANPQRLKLELTESLLVNDVEDTIAKMTALREHGVGFSLDDFGTGYSSLSYLKRLPLDQLKIDQSFVRDLMTDPNDASIARTVITLGHSLGLTVIAEGVETAAQQDFLAQQGCDAYQGYLFGRPMPLAEFEQYMHAG